MSDITLYHNDMSVCAAKVRMALAEKDLAWDGIHLNLRAGDTQKPDYVKLNPGKVVPTLVHDGVPIIESNVICEYIDDTWPDRPLRPAPPRGKARMRLWMKQLDETVHAATGVVSTCVAFRHQYLQRSPEELRAYYAAMPDPVRREARQQAIERGMDAPVFAPAVKRFMKLVTDMDRDLADGPWLAGAEYSLADIAYAPYMARLKHLGLDVMIEGRPRVLAWRERLFAKPGYKAGIEKWFNPSYLEIFDREREGARAHTRKIMAG
jgi:glutathione S-transferase